MCNYTPRYKNLKGRSDDGLIGFNSTSHYQDFLLKPNRKVKESLVITEWPNIQRIMASLALKETTHQRTWNCGIEGEFVVQLNDLLQISGGWVKKPV